LPSGSSNCSTRHRSVCPARRSSICRDHRFHRAEPCADLALLEPVTRANVIAIIAEAKSMGLEYEVAETFRSQELQERYFEQRATRLRHVGVHHYGLACDIRWIVDGKFVTNGSKYQVMRWLAEKHGMISGGDWGTPTQPHSFRDYDHVQRIALSRQNDLFAGRWYPDERYRPLADLHRTKPTPSNLSNGKPMPWRATHAQLEAA
jgi:hypothetical protein